MIQFPRMRHTKYKFTLPDNQVVDDIYAPNDAEAVLELERVKPGCSQSIVRVDRDDLWFLREPPARRTGAA